MTDMLSRIADSLFWLARYMERAEYTARILDVNYHMLLEQSQQPYRMHWEPLIVMAGEQERFHPFYEEANARNGVRVSRVFAGKSQFHRAIASPRRAKTPAPFATAFRARCGKTSTASITRSATLIPARKWLPGPHRLCETVKFGSHRFHGVTDATLPHDEGWEFLRIGSALERAEMTARLVDVQYHNLLDAPADLVEPDNHQWMAVLRSVGAYEAYHREYHSPIEPEKVAEMLILHPQHPRSIRFSTNRGAVPACEPSAAAVPDRMPTRRNASPGKFWNACATTDRRNFQTRACTII